MSMSSAHTTPSSPSSPTASMSSLSSDALSVSSCSALRPNEHLAVLLPRSLWKRDSLATTCDTFSCGTVFSSFFERRHHCRKCGGVFCSKCTARTTALLDTSSLPFLHPPRNTSIYNFISEGGLVLEDARVCDDCWDQLHGVRGPSSMPSSPISSQILTPSPVISVTSTTLSDSSSSSSTGSPRTPPDTLLLTSSLSRLSTVSTRTSNPDLRRKATLAAQARTSRSSTPTSPTISHGPLPQGELSNYPLCRSSSLCKASGGGRWEPKQSLAREEERVLDMDASLLLSSSPTSMRSDSFSSHRPRSRRSTNPAPTLGIGKALWEVEWERQMRKHKVRKENPVVRDGEFCYRVYAGAAERCTTDEDDDGYETFRVVEGATKGTTTLARSFSLSTF